jgi:hypothetical protein
VSYSFTTLLTSSGGNSDNILKLNKLRCSCLSQVHSHKEEILTADTRGCTQVRKKKRQKEIFGTRITRITRMMKTFGGGTGKRSKGETGIIEEEKMEHE